MAILSVVSHKGKKIEWTDKVIGAGTMKDVYFSPDGSNDTSLSFNPNSTSNDINIYYNGTYKIRLSRSFSYNSLKDFGSYTIFLAQAYALLC